jgi:hypothetical protein
MPDKKMSKRGAGRPGNHSPEANSKSNDEKAEKMMKRKESLHSHYKQTLWIYWTLIILGIWMIASPLTFDYFKNPAVPSGGREVWLPLNTRISAMIGSDILSGLILIVFGWRALLPNRPYSLWICCFTGIWLSMAPLVFWSPSAIGYLNGTLVGALVIALSVLIPGMPNMIMYMKMGNETPEGWSYNPSSWPQRWIMIVLAYLGWIFSRYLAAFQLGYIDYAWDPFFGESTMKVINSKMSHSWPVSDAGLGSLAYTFEFLMGYMGSPARWRTMPWMVTFFGILVIPLGFVSIFLVTSQPLTVGAWCTFCLITAIIMLPMIPLQIDEVIAMGQHLVERSKRGDSLWKVFWKGGEPVNTSEDARTPDLISLPQNPWQVFNASIVGMSFPWTLSLTVVFGVLMMFLPGSFGISINSTLADISHLGGALIVVFGVIAMAEVLRACRFLNVITGVIVAFLPWLFYQGEIEFLLCNTILAILVSILSLFKGKIFEKYGLWQSYIW